MNPATGSTAGGTSITISGTGFTGASSVNVGGSAATNVTVVNDTTITATTPAGTAGAADIAVSTTDGTGTGVGVFTYVAPPTVTGVNPSAGPTAGGTSITITGTNFTTGATVTVGGNAASNVTVVNSTTITATTPAGTAGAADVAVTATGGVGTATGLFTYAAPPTITSINPTYGTTSVGGAVSIFGTNFIDVTSVTFGGTPGTSLRVNGTTSLSIRAPAKPEGTYNVTVVTAGGTATVTNGYTFYNAPTVTTVSPSVGPLSGGNTLTITGTNLTGVSSVRIGTLGSTTAATSLTIVSNTQITAVAPAKAAGIYGVFITTSYGSANKANSYRYIAAPTVNSISPTSGSAAGGTTVTISGSNFSSLTSPAFAPSAVSIGGVPVTSFIVDSPTQITAVTAARAAGLGSVSVTTAGGTGSAADSFTYIAAPAISSISPDAGPVAGGTSVTITGTGFTNASAVVFDNTPSAGGFTVVSDTQITATTPAGTAGAVDVGVTTPGGTANTANGFTYIGAPVISSVSPAGGPVAGGTLVTINGTDVGGATAVSFGGAAATNITTVSASQITAIAPAGTAGQADVQVTTPGGSATASNAFLYASPPTLSGISPGAGPATGGSTVTITGTNLLNASAITFGGVAAASFTVDNATQITATTPAGTAGAVDVSVTTPGGTATAASAFTYASAPTITTVTPSEGRQAGGTPVTVTGTNLTGATSVTFGGVAGTSLTVVNATTLVVNAPAGTPGQVDVVVTTAGGTATLANGYIIVPAPSITSFTPTSGPTAGGQTLVITGTNFTGATTVRAGPTSLTFTVNSATQITATTAVRSAGTVPIQVTTPGGMASLAGYTYVGPPTVTSLSPSSGPVAGGVTVAITGTGFTGATAVSFGSAAATAFTVVNGTQINATAPAGTAGAVGVSVTTAGGTVTSPSAFAYVNGPSISSVSPAEGPVGGGATVIISGTDFTGATAVSFGGTAAASFTVMSATQITAVTPAGTAGQVDVSVTTPAGTGTASNAFTYGGAPVIAAVSPATGPAAGGTTVTITGTDLTGATAVSFGSTTAADFSVVSANEIRATTPPGNAGSVSVSVTTPGGTATAGNAFTYADLPRITAISPDTGPTTGGTSVVISGSNLTGATAVRFGAAAATRFEVDNATRITAVAPAGSAGAVEISVTTSGGTGRSANSFIYIEQTPQAAFDTYKKDVTRIVQDQAKQQLTALIGGNVLMMQDARSRFIGVQGGGQAALTADGFDAIAFDVDGTIDVEGGFTGIVATSSGSFLGQTGMVDGANWRLSGAFDVLMHGDQTMTTVDGRVAREQFIGRSVLWGAFGGGQFSSGDIADSFTGSETTWQLFAGTYGVTRFTNYVFGDAYASAGYGWSDLAMNNTELALDSTYGTLTWQVGGSLTGLINLDRFSLLPTLSLAYGNSNLGEIDFTAGAYGLTDDVTLDAGSVGMGVLRFTAEMRIPLGGTDSAAEGVTLGLLPSLICQTVIADNSESDCGWGGGIELTQQGITGPGQFNGRFDYEEVGGISRIGGQIGYSVQF